MSEVEDKNEGRDEDKTEETLPVDIGPTVQQALMGVVQSLSLLEDDDARCRVLCAARCICGIEGGGMRFLQGLLDGAQELLPKVLEVFAAYQAGREMDATAVGATMGVPSTPPGPPDQG